MSWTPLSLQVNYFIFNERTRCRDIHVPAPGAAPAGGKPIEREVHVAVTNGTKGKAQVRVALDLPQGCRSDRANRLHPRR
jgi:hypothetical protein